MIIGITGGIGSGKSTIAKQLRQMGYEVYDTDSEAKRIIVEDATVREQMTVLFGPEAYKDGVYQTAFVAQQVFADKTLLARLNAIVHPAVRQDILTALPLHPLGGSRRGAYFSSNAPSSIQHISMSSVIRLWWLRLPKKYD